MSRATGLQRLEQVLPLLGRDYARDRGLDLGAGRHRAVSRLSPWLRRRLLSEDEVIGAVLDVHGPEAGAKFIQEVFWRGYFKGHLQHRPGLWRDYLEGLGRDLDQLERDPGLAARVAAAEAGRTGLDCMDAWAQELLATGYLHNHARMWFASIWIFTLRLPWRVGADFLHRHLLDGDAASNTLGWRWVAGLHRNGRPYLADAGVIARQTRGRLTPRPDQLAAEAQPVAEPPIEAGPPAAPASGLSAAKGATGVLVTDQDCRPEAMGPVDPAAVACLEASHLRSVRPVAAGVVTADRQALQDAAARLGMGADRLVADDPAVLADWAVAAGLSRVVTPFVPQGPVRNWLDAALPILARQGIAFEEWPHPWDGLVWPHAGRGFFKLADRIPQILAARQG